MRVSWPLVATDASTDKGTKENHMVTGLGVVVIRGGSLRTFRQALVTQSAPGGEVAGIGFGSDLGDYRKQLPLRAPWQRWVE